jgi:hypothetical protein
MCAVIYISIVCIDQNVRKYIGRGPEFFASSNLGPHPIPPAADTAKTDRSPSFSLSLSTLCVADTHARQGGGRVQI